MIRMDFANMGGSRSEGVSVARQQVKSKERVEEHGEVFTNEREVNAMLDLVKQETERIESRFLEPACGDGNFLAEVLRRKLAVVAQRYGKSQLEYERYAFLAVSSIYGVDIMQDNVEECRRRLFDEFDGIYTGLYKNEAKDEFRNVVRYVLSVNILCGDALTLTTAGGDPIVFPEWSLVSGSKVKRRDYTFASLLDKSEAQPTFDMIEDFDVDKDDPEKILPTPVREYPMRNYLEVAEMSSGLSLGNKSYIRTCCHAWRTCPTMRCSLRRSWPTKCLTCCQRKSGMTVRPRFWIRSPKQASFLREITKRLIKGLEDEIPDLQKRIDISLTSRCGV